MQQLLGLALLSAVIAFPAYADESLKVVYPPANHETTSERIFLIGTAPPQAEVTVNGQLISDRSPAGHFAPSLPLELGENIFTLRDKDQFVTVQVRRLPKSASQPRGLAFANGSLTPAVAIAKLPNEPICFSGVAPPHSNVSVKLAGQTIPLFAQIQAVDLPPNSAVLTQTNQPTTNVVSGLYQGCTAVSTPGNLGKPLFLLTKNGKTFRQEAAGSIKILSPAQFSVAEVTRDQGVARTGPSTDYSRLTPLPKGTQAKVTGREGAWLRLDYGGWIDQKEVRVQAHGMPQSIIRSVRTQPVSGWTEVVFPLQAPVPVMASQGERTFTLTLYNTTAQTDVIRLDNDPVISRLDWQQVAPGQVQYTFNLKSSQQWGYKLRYEGTSLILSLRHSPIIIRNNLPLSGVKVLLDPGHGSKNDLGSIGPTGYPEKDAALVVSKLLRQELSRRGATVIMTREGDEDLYPQDRVTMIEKTEPNLAVSLHYNALPDNGDALHTQGVGAFWYQAQSHDLAMFLQNYLVKKLDRPTYGVFWDNLALTRPTVAPAVLLELGFMTNPNEFEWITNLQAQKQLAATLADGITKWLTVVHKSS